MAIKVGLYGQRSNQPALGKFASAIAEGLEADNRFQLFLSESDTPPDALDAIVYARRTDDKLAEALRLADRLDASVYLLATNMQDSLAKIPHQAPVHIIPNTSQEVTDYIESVAAFHQAHSSWSAHITEYHQSSKQDISGTALAIAEQIGVQPHEIQTIRDDAEATKLFGVPPQHQSSYAVHQITFTNPETKTTQLFQIVVTGHQTYVAGLIKLLLAR